MLKEAAFVGMLPAFPSSSFSLLSFSWSSPHLPAMLPSTLSAITAMSQSFSRTAAPLGFALARLGYFCCTLQVPREMEEKLRAETDSCRSAILDSSYMSPFHVFSLFYMQSCLHSCWSLPLQYRGILFCELIILPGHARVSLAAGLCCPSWFSLLTILFHLSHVFFLDCSPQTFGIPLCQVIANDRANRQLQETVKSSRRFCVEVEETVTNFRAQMQKRSPLGRGCLLVPYEVFPEEPLSPDFPDHNSSWSQRRVRLQKWANFCGRIVVIVLQAGEAQANVMATVHALRG